MTNMIRHSTRKLEQGQLNSERLNLICEYYELSSCLSNTEQEMERIAEILELAESDDALSLLIAKVDIFLAEGSNLLSPESLHELKNQIARLAEHLEFSYDDDLTKIDSAS
jgi:hypothetical protein